MWSRKLTLLGHIIRAKGRNKDDPMFNVTFASSSGKPKLRNERRVGRPRLKWITETMKSAWYNIRAENADTSDYLGTSEQIHKIMDAAKAYKHCFKTKMVQG